MVLLRRVVREKFRDGKTSGEGEGVAEGPAVRNQSLVSSSPAAAVQPAEGAKDLSYAAALKGKRACASIKPVPNK